MDNMQMIAGVRQGSIFASGAAQLAGLPSPAMSLRNVATLTLEILEAGRYVAPSGAEVEIGDDQAAAVEDSTLYTPGELRALIARPGPGGPPPTIVVTDETTQVAARRLVEGGARDLVLLNFASARNPGGGFLGGAKAQEEDLCRCSGLYPTLLEHPDYYEVNRRQSSLLYTDHLIYSPDVPFFRVRGRGELLERPFLASVITAPAPNTGPLLQRDPDAGPAIRETFRRRWAIVLAVAEARGHRNVLLGAWGCGAFGGDPSVAADTVAEWLESPRFAGSFDQVVFAIPDGGRSGVNLAAFRDRLASARAG